ncbi:MAG: hypothetical protein WCJ69_17055 [Betaproteobacteria bacterium]
MNVRTSTLSILVLAITTVGAVAHAADARPPASGPAASHPQLAGDHDGQAAHGKRLKHRKAGGGAADAGGHK